MVDFASLKERVGVADVIQLLSLPMTREGKINPETSKPYFVWRGVCPACRGGRLSLVATELRGFTCFHRKTSTNPDRWPSGDVIAFHAHVLGMDREAAAYALDTQITFAETPTKPL